MKNTEGRAQRVSTSPGALPSVFFVPARAEGEASVQPLRESTPAQEIEMRFVACVRSPIPPGSLYVTVDLGGVRREHDARPIVERAARKGFWDSTGTFYPPQGIFSIQLKINAERRTA